MNLPTQIDGLANASLPARPVHLAIGMFDGVHLGHRAVIDTAVQAAQRSGGLAVVLTFWPHPSAVFRPENPTLLIQNPPTKARVLVRLGVDTIVTQPFTLELARLEAPDFLPWLRQMLPTLAAIYVGANFRFGQGRRGDVVQLLASAQKLGVGVLSAPRVNLDGHPISSTRIRTLIKNGEIATANLLLGYPYFADGIVTPGKRLGRGLGFPTLNLPWSPSLHPRFGVYIVRVISANLSAPLPGVANYGLRPTVEQTTEPRLESHVIGPCSINTGDAITVEWLRFLRPERKFGDLDELRAQIEQDREIASADFSLH